MDLILLLQYALSLTAVTFIAIGLSCFKKALLRYCRKFQKPPSNR